ncbi:MAG: ribose-phosphate diphosphokinase [Candidatus Zixiibacteriota bacterium]
MKILIGRSNRRLGQEICNHLGVKPIDAIIENFADGEIRIQLKENIRGTDLFIIQSLNPPAENLLELLLLIDAARRASARRITAVIPYFGYARQDRKEKPRVPISAKLLSRLLEDAGANRVLTVDLHAAQIQGFFEIPVDQIISDELLAAFIHGYYERTDGMTTVSEEVKGIKSKDDKIVIVSPDVGGVKRIEDIADDMGANMAIVHKKRDEPNQSKALVVIGDVKEKIAIIRDDMIDTGGTLTHAAELLKQNGAKKIYAFCTHALFSGPAIDRICDSELDKLAVTDTIQIQPKRLQRLKDKNLLDIISVAPILSTAIGNIHHERSVSVLLRRDNWD